MELALGLRIGLAALLILLPALAGAGIGASALAAPLPTFGGYQVKGFLSDYSKIRPAGGDRKTFLYRNPIGDKSRYRKLMIDPIKIRTKDNGWPREGDVQLDELAAYFHQAILKAVSDTYPVVGKPGPDVLRLRIAVTDLEPNDPGVSLLTLVVPFLWLGEASAGVAQGEPGSTPFVGQTTVEMEALDSQTNAQVAAYIERHVGKKYAWDEGISVGLANYMKAFSTWAYTEEAFDRWAGLLRNELDAEQGKAVDQP
jgi:hypothetical protein